MPIRLFDIQPMPLEQQYAQQQQAAMYQATATPQFAQQVTEMVRLNPTMRPGTALALAQGQVDPSGPIAAAVVQKEAEQRQKKGFGFHSIGDLVASGVSHAGGAVGEVAGEAYGAVKGVSRGMWMGTSAVGQTFQGAFRESVADGDISGSEWLLGLPHYLGKGFAQTDLAAGIDQIGERGLTGLDYGSGFFPGGQVAATGVQRRRAAAPLIDGHAASMGRYTAKRFFEPGSKPYGLTSGLLDATEAIASDPTSWLGGGTTKLGSSGVRQGVKDAKGFTGSTAEVTIDKATGAVSRDALNFEAGVVDGTRKTVLSDVAYDWLSMNKQGRQVVEVAAKTTDVAKLRRLLKADKNGIDTATLVKLADSPDERAVIETLGPLLGKEVRQKFSAGATDGFKASFADAKASSRWASLMPHHHTDLEDLDDFIDQLDRFGSTVKMPLADRDAFVNRAARTTSRGERLQLAKDFFSHIQDDVLDGARISAADRRVLTRMHAATFDDLEMARAYAINEVGQPMRVPGAPTQVLNNGDIVPLPSPHLLSEYTGRYLPLPDARALRAETSKVMATLGKIKGARRASDALIAGGETATALFKVGALARFAYPIRVVGEEQARLAASGHVSMFAHPLSYIGVVMGRKGDRDLLDNVFEEGTEFGDSLSVGSAGLNGPGKGARAFGKTAMKRDHPQFAKYLLDNLSEYHNDAVAKRVAMGRLFDGDKVNSGPQLPGIDGIKQWFFDGAGQGWRKELGSGSDNAAATAKRADIFGVKSNAADPLNSADGYIDSMVERLRTATNGDPRLMQVIAEGKIEGVPLMIQTAPKQFQVNPAAITKMEQLLSDPAVGPQFVKGDVFVTDGVGKAPSFSKIGEHFDKATEFMFDWLMSKPTNNLSRSPAFKQFYWQRQAELIEHMRPDVQAQALRVARESGVVKSVVKQLEAGAKRRSGNLDFAEADQLGKAYGVDSVKGLLYDLHDRNQFFDAMRVVFPFGEAWKEVAQTWAKIGMENPLVAHRGQQLVNGLRSANADGQDEGLFYTNANGEESFALPFSGWINSKATGVDATFTAPVKGLNLFASSIMPGLGPVITMPMSRLMPNRPEYDDMRKLLMPFGEKEYDDGVLGGFTGSLMPGWMNRGIKAWTDDPGKDRIFANNVAYAARYLMSTGKYSTDSPEAKDKLEQDSVAAARKLTMLRAFAQAFSPSPPSPEYVALDKNGDGMVQARLVEEYAKLQAEDYKTATQKFVDTFGEQALLTTIPRTSGGAPPTDVTNDFVRDNQDVVRKYGDVYGYFLPRGGEFSYEAYQGQIKRGEREVVTPKEAIERANQRLGTMVYSQYKAQVGDTPTAEQRAWLGQVRDAIEAKYPGYSATPATLRDQKLQIDQLVAAAKDPTLAATEAGQGLTEYLQYRDQALELAKDRGLQSFASAKKASDLREWLRTAADDIGQRYPDFLEMFDRTFNREMVADDGD